MLKDHKKIERRYLRYRREDINVHLYLTLGGFKSVELLNISQQGMAIRGHLNLKINKKISSKIIFPTGQVFTESSRIVSKVKTSLKPENTEKQRRWTWLLGGVDNFMYDYSLEFDNISSEFKILLLSSNIQKRLEHYDIK